MAEDNLTNQKVIMRQLESLGYLSELVSNGQAAVDAMAQTAYPIVLMDCRLPKMDGYTAARLIRQHEQAHQSEPAVIIALTASDHPGAETEAMAAGMDTFLTKPLRREALAAVLGEWSQILLQRWSGSAKVSQSGFNLHLDLERLHQLSEHNLEFEQELLQLYLSDTQDQIRQLLQAVGQEDLLQIERTAHHIRGASASVGAIQLENISMALERGAPQHPERTGLLMQQLQQAFAQFKAIVQKTT